MVQRVATVAFEGIEARAVDVQVQVAPGLPAFNVVGLADKAVSEARERVRAALVASGLALPARRITVNLAPADLPKEGSHYDLPIALGLMAAIGAIPGDALSGFTVLGELGLDGSIAAVAGVLPAAIGANARGEGLICPGRLRRRGRLGEPGHGDHRGALADPARQSFPRHAGARPPAAEGARGRRRARRPQGHQGPGERQARARGRRRRRAQSADGRPARRRQVDAGGAAADDPAAADAGRIARSLDDRIGRRRRSRTVRSPIAGRSARRIIPPACRRWSAAACARGPAKSRSRITACSFSTSSPEFQPQALDSLRQPLETGEVAIARANHRVTYPARFMLVAAMNPCRCGRASEPGFACKRGDVDRCAADYQGKLSGPLMDRIDLHIEVPAVTAADLILPPPTEGSREVAERVARARAMQAERYAAIGLPHIRTNAAAQGPVLEDVARPDAGGLTLLRDAADAMRLSARGYHRVLRVARTLADLDGVEKVSRVHLAEALSYRALADEVRRAA